MHRHLHEVVFQVWLGMEKTHTHLIGQNIQIKFTATFVGFNLCYKTCCIGNYFKPLRKNIHGLRCNWFRFFFGEKVREDLWKERRRTVEKQDLRLFRDDWGIVCLGSCSIIYIVVLFVCVCVCVVFF